ncbi:MAG: hypothetical protein ACR2GU_16035 [Rubrobacteraceae bacterium]
MYKEPRKPLYLDLARARQDANARLSIGFGVAFVPQSPTLSTRRTWCRKRETFRQCGFIHRAGYARHR